MANPSLSTEDSFNPLRGILFAVAILIVAAIAIFALNPTKTAVLTIPHVDIFAPHTEFKAMAGPAGTHIIGQPNASEDDLYVIATVRLEDKLHLPIFVAYAGATMQNADGTESTATVISTHDIPNLETTFPAITAMLPHPLLNGAQISPGGAAEGQVLLLFPNSTRKSWDTKKSATLTLNLLRQDPISAPLN
jgi:hypothetical protein